MTNGDRIRQMTDEELAKMLTAHMASKEFHDFNCRVCPVHVDDCNCEKNCFKWLKQEAEE